jgi:uncharacterized membrane protein
VAEDIEHHQGRELPPETSEVHGEPRLPVVITMAVVVVLPLLLPQSFTPVPRVVAPLVFAGFAVAVLAMDPGRIDRRGQAIHRVRMAYVLVLAAFDVFATAELTAVLIRGRAGITDSPGKLLLTGGLVWISMAITFAFLYWELDLGGPGERAHRQRVHPDFGFPQDMSPDIAPPGWRPEFLDYLYLGLTNNIAFSPTDVMPLKHWAKGAMALQSLASLLVMGLVIARAVNILN